MAKRRTLAWLAGLDRSQPAPVQTSSHEPLRPWTIPNLIGYIRLVLIPIFLVIAFESSDGRSAAAAAVFAVIAAGDYVDGVAARLTGQYSRMGALLDPLVDRLLVIAGAIVCWHFELLPRWALALLFARELLMLLLSKWGLSHGLTLRINWFGRLGVWPIMAAPFFAMVGLKGFATILLYVGLIFALSATVLYILEGRQQLKRIRDEKSNKSQKSQPQP